MTGAQKEPHAMCDAEQGPWAPSPHLQNGTVTQHTPKGQERVKRAHLSRLLRTGPGVGFLGALLVGAKGWQE